MNLDPTSLKRKIGHISALLIRKGKRLACSMAYGAFAYSELGPVQVFVKGFPGRAEAKELFHLLTCDISKEQMPSPTKKRGTSPASGTECRWNDGTERGQILDTRVTVADCDRTLCPRVNWQRPQNHKTRRSHEGFGPIG